MTLYALDASFTFTAGPNDPALEDWLDSVSTHLGKLSAKGVSMVSEDSGAFTVTLVVDTDEDTEIHDVVKAGMDTLRTAFRPTPREAMGGVRVALIESSQRLLVSA